MNINQVRILAIIVTLLFYMAVGVCFAKEYNNDEIVDAIFWAEGGYKTNYPFGIKSVKCEGYNHCRRICVNTVRNNRKRYADYGHKDFDTYLEFLQSRYCPTSGKLDWEEQRLNHYWLKNVKWFLENPKEQGR